MARRFHSKGNASAVGDQTALSKVGPECCGAACAGGKRLSLSAFVTTNTDDSAMAAEARTGESSMPFTG